MYPTPIYRHLVPLSVKMEKVHSDGISRNLPRERMRFTKRGSRRDLFDIEEDREDKCRTRNAGDAKGKDDVNGRYYRNSSAFRTGMRPSSFPPFRPFSTERLFRVLEATIAPLTEIPAFAYQGTATV